jgi:hypothetical protein
MLRVLKRDLLASTLVVVAGVLYMLWASDTALPGLRSTRATGLVVLGLGFAASASAVVPGFYGLIHRSKGYLAMTSLIGLLALGAGLWMLIYSSDVALGLLISSMGMLWLIATIHHVLLARWAAVARPSS